MVLLGCGVVADYDSDVRHSSEGEPPTKADGGVRVR
jgi:hypothetical protein